ncbi:O-antigen ligase family protein [Ureibacillus acetophenoni]
MLKTWAISATISSFISIFTFFSNGNGLSSLFSLSDLSTQEFYSIKFSNSLFFEDPNNLATYLLLSIFITIGLCFKKIIAYKYGYLLVVVQVLGLILTLSRSAYLAAIIAILVYLFVNKLNSIGWFFLKIGLISIITFFSITFIFSLNTDISAISRFGLWNVGINMTLSNPILGVGIGNSSILFTQYVSSSLVIFNPHFHNLYLTISSEIGFVGLISFLLIFTKHLYSWIASNDQLYKFMCLALIAYLVQSIGVEYFASRHFWIFVAILLIYNSIPQQRGSDLVSN